MMSRLLSFASIALLSLSSAALVSAVDPPATPTQQVVIDSQKVLTAKQAFDIFLSGMPGGIPYVPSTDLGGLQNPRFIKTETGETLATCNGVDQSSAVRQFTAGSADFGFTTGLLILGDCDLVAVLALTEKMKATGLFYFYTLATLPTPAKDTFDLLVDGAAESSYDTTQLGTSPQPNFPGSLPGASGTSSVGGADSIVLPKGTVTIRLRLNSHWFNAEDLGADNPANSDKAQVAITPLKITSGRVVGDPQFYGFLGQSYQIHGTADTVYNVISTPEFQYNALFSFLKKGECRQGTACFSHAGNYFGEVGMSLKSDDGSKTNILVMSGPVATGLTMTVNGQVKSVGEKVTVGAYTVSLVSAFEVAIESQDFNIVLQNSDMFLNQMVSIGKGLMSKIASYKLAVKTSANTEAALAPLPHGLLGQTWQNVEYDNIWKYIQGQLFDYIQQDGIFGTQNKYNKY